MDNQAFDSTNRFVVFSRQQAETWEVPGSYAVISISNVSHGDTSECAVRFGYHSILRVAFDDVDPGLHDSDLVPINETQAEQIVRFWNQHKDEVDRFVIHCEQGLSRSAGVGSALAWLERNAQADRACHNGTHPNRHVKHALGQAARRLGLGPYARMAGRDRDMTM